MAAQSLSRGRLRRLADVHPDRGRVLSVFMNLDPSELPTPAARSSAVTGGNGAIGRAVVAALAAAGARSRVAERPDIDLLQAAASERLVSAVLEQEGRLDGVIHTVGGFSMAKVHEAPLADYDRMMDLDVRSLFHVARAVVPISSAPGRPRSNRGRCFAPARKWCSGLRHSAPRRRGLWRAGRGAASSGS